MYRNDRKANKPLPPIPQKCLVLYKQRLHNSFIGISSPSDTKTLHATQERKPPETIPPKITIQERPLPYKPQIRI